MFLYKYKGIFLKALKEFTPHKRLTTNSVGQLNLHYTNQERGQTMSNIKTNLCYMPANNAAQPKKADEKKERPFFRNPIETFKAQDTKGKVAFVTSTGTAAVGLGYVTNNFKKYTKAKRELDTLNRRLEIFSQGNNPIDTQYEIPKIKNNISNTKNIIKKAKVKMGVGLLVPFAISLIARAFINRDV